MFDKFILFWDRMNGVHVFPWTANRMERRMTRRVLTCVAHHNNTHHTQNHTHVISHTHTVTHWFLSYKALLSAGRKPMQHIILFIMVSPETQKDEGDNPFLLSLVSFALVHSWFLKLHFHAGCMHLLNQFYNIYIVKFFAQRNCKILANSKFISLESLQGCMDCFFECVCWSGGAW